MSTLITPLKEHLKTTLWAIAWGFAGAQTPVCSNEETWVACGVRLELKMSYLTFTPDFVDSRWIITGKSSIITNGKCIANVFKHSLKSNLYFWYVIWMWTQINKDSLNTFTSVWWSSSRWFGPWLVPFMIRMTVSFSSDKTGYTANKTS